MNGRMDGWIDEHDWMTEWMTEWMNETEWHDMKCNVMKRHEIEGTWRNEALKQWVHELMNEWMNEWMSE